MDNEVKKDNKYLWVKILIVILILAVVAGIYVYKKVQENQSTAQNTDEESLPLEISSLDLDEIKSYGLPFVIDFGSDSCKPCIAMAPILETLHEEWQGKAIVQFVDVWENPTAAKDFPVSLIPTQVFYYADGTPFVPSNELANEIAFIMPISEDTNEQIFTMHQGYITEDEMRKIFAEMGVE